MKFELVKLSKLSGRRTTIYSAILADDKFTKTQFNMKKMARSYQSAIIDDFIALENPELTAIVEKKMRLAAKIYDSMQAQNISNKVFAECLHVSPSLVTKWLSGQHNFTVDTLVRIEQVLDIELINSEKIAA